MKRCLTSLAIRGIQAKITLSKHLTPVRMTVIYETCNHKYWIGLTWGGFDLDFVLHFPLSHCRSNTHSTLQ